MNNDRKPLEFEGRFLWHAVPDDDNLGSQFDYLPRDVFDRLDMFIHRDNPRVTQIVKAYTTAENAMTALDRAKKPI